MDYEQQWRAEWKDFHALVDMLEIYPTGERLLAVLDFMRHHGQSVNLGWGEDNDAWECSWITGGDRYTGAGSTVARAVVASCRRVKALVTAEW